MGTAVGADQYAGVGRADLDIAVGVGQRVAYLIIGAPGGEGGEGAGENRGPEGRHAGGKADQVGLGDAHVEEPLGILLGEMHCLGRLREVGVHDIEIILFGQLYQGCAVSFTGGSH